jgi:hypothetical protein
MLGFNGCTVAAMILMFVMSVTNFVFMMVASFCWLEEPGLIHCSGGDLSFPEPHLGPTQPAISVTEVLPQSWRGTLPLFVCCLGYVKPSEANPTERKFLCVFNDVFGVTILFLILC